MRLAVAVAIALALGGCASTNYARVYLATGGASRSGDAVDAAGSLLHLEIGTVKKTAGLGYGFETRLIEMASLPDSEAVGDGAFRVSGLPIGVRWHLLGWFRSGVLHSAARYESGYWITRDAATGQVISSTPGSRQVEAERNDPVRKETLGIGLFARGVPLSLSRGTPADADRQNRYDPFAEIGAYALAGLSGRHLFLGAGIELQAGAAAYLESGVVYFVRLEVLLFGAGHRNAF